MTDQDLGAVQGVQTRASDLQAYLEDRRQKGWTTPEDERMLERLRTRSEEVGAWEGLFLSPLGREKSLVEFLPFVGTAADAVYAKQLVDALDAAEANKATPQQTKLLADFEDFNHRKWSTWGKATNIAGDSLSFMGELYMANVAGSVAREGVKKISNRALGRLLNTIVSPVRKFDGALTNIIARSQQAAQGGRAASAFGPMGLGGVAATLARAGTTQAAELTLGTTALGEAYGAAFGGGSRVRVAQLQNYVGEKFGGVDAHGAVRIMNNDYGMWTDALPKAFVDQYIEQFSEQAGLALVHLPSALKIGLTGQRFAKTGTSNRVLSMLGLSPNPVDLGAWSRIGQQGLVGELGEEFLGGAARDAVHALAPELADEGNVDALIEDIVPVTLGLAMGAGLPTWAMASRNYVDNALSYHGASENVRNAYDAWASQYSDADKQAITRRVTGLGAFMRDGFSAIGTGQLAMTEGLRARFHKSEPARLEAARRVRQSHQDMDYRVREHELTEELDQMIGEVMQGRLISADGQTSPVVDLLEEYGVVTGEQKQEVLNEATRRARMLLDAFESGNVDRLLRTHARSALARELGAAEREDLPEGPVRAMWDRRAHQRVLKELNEMRALFGQARGAQPLEEGQLGPAVPQELSDKARAEIEQRVAQEFIEDQPTAASQKLLTKQFDQLQGTTEEAVAAQNAVVGRLAQIGRDRGLPQAPQVVKWDTDLPGGQIARQTNAQVVEIEGMDQPAFFDPETGLVFVDRAKLQERADMTGLTLERQSVRSVAHEMMHVRQQELAKQTDREQFAKNTDRFLTSIGLKQDAVTELQSPEYANLSPLERLEEANSYRTEALAELLFNGKASEQQKAEAKKSGFLRQLVTDILEAALPRTRAVNKQVQAMRQRLTEVGIDEAQLSDAQVMGYLMGADGMGRVLLNEEAPKPIQLALAMEDPEQAIEEGPKEFWDSVRGEAPLPRPARGPVAGAVQELLLDPTGELQPTAEVLSEKLRLPSRVAADVKMDPARQQAASIEQADGVVIYTSDAKADKAKIDAIKKLAGVGKKADAVKKPVIINPSADQLRRFVQMHSLQRPYVTSLGGAATVPAARQSLLEAFDVVGPQGESTVAALGVRPAPPIQGPYGGITAAEVARRFLANQEIPDLTAADPNSLPDTVAASDAVIVVGDDPAEWAEVLGELTEENGEYYLDRGEAEPVQEPRPGPTIAAQSARAVERSTVTGRVLEGPEKPGELRGPTETLPSPQEQATQQEAQRLAEFGETYTGAQGEVIPQKIDRDKPVSLRGRYQAARERMAPVLQNPRTVAELQAYMVRYGVRAPLIVGPAKAVQRVKELYAEALQPKDSLMSLVQVDRGSRQRVDPFRESWYGETLDVVQQDAADIERITIFGPVSVNARGEYLYPEPEHYALTDDRVMSDEARMQIEMLRTASGEQMLDALDAEIDRIFDTLTGERRAEALRDLYQDLAGGEVMSGLWFGPRDDIKTTNGRRRALRRAGLDLYQRGYAEDGETAVGKGPRGPLGEGVTAREYQLEVLRGALLRRAMRGSLTGAAPELGRVEMRQREAWRRIDDISYNLPERLLVPFANADVGDRVMFRDREVIMPGVVNRDKGDSVEVAYLTSDGVKEFITIRRKNLHHQQLSLHLSGSEPVYADGKLVHGGRMVWRRGLSVVRPQLFTGSETAELVLEAQEGETPEEFGRRVEQAGYDLLQQYPDMLTIAQQGQYVPEAPNKKSTEWRTRSRELRTSLLAAGKRSMMVDTLARLIDVRSDVIQDLLVVNLFGKKRGIKVNRSTQSRLAKELGDALQGRERARGEATEDPEQTQRQRDLREAFASEIDMIIEPIEDQLIQYFRGTIDILDIRKEYEALVAQREKYGAKVAGRVEVGLRTMLEVIEQVREADVDILQSRALAMSSAEFEPMLASTALEPWEIAAAKEEAEKKGVPFTYANAPASVQLAVRERLREDDEEAAKAERIESDEGGGMAEQGQRGQAAFQKAQERQKVRETARLRSLPELAGRMVVALHNLHHDAMVQEAEQFDAARLGVVRVPGMSDADYRSQLTARRKAANEALEAQWNAIGGREWWWQHAENPYFKAMGGAIASTAAHAAVLTPRAISAVEVPEAQRGEGAGEEMRASALVHLVQGLSFVGIGPKAGDFYTLQPVTAMTQATVPQLLQALGMSHRLQDMPQLTRRELNALLNRTQRREGGQFAPGFEREETVMDQPVVRELVQALSHDNILQLAEWFEANADVASNQVKLTKKLRRLQELSKLHLRKEGSDATREEAAKLDQEIKVLKTRLQLGEQLTQYNAWNEWKNTLTAYKGKFEGPDKSRALQSAMALYQGLSRMRLFRESNTYKEALEIARLLTGVRYGMLMTQYAMQNAQGLADHHRAEVDAGRPVLDSALGVSLGDASQQVADALAERMALYEAVHELLEQGSLKGALVALVANHKVSPVITHAAHASKVQRMGQLRGLEFLQKQLETAGAKGGQILIAPRGPLDLHLVLDPMVVYSPTAASMTEHQAAQMTPGMPQHEQLFPRAYAFDFAGNASPMGVFRDALNRHLETSVRDRVLNELTRVEALKNRDLTSDEVLAILQQQDLLLAQSYQQALDARNARLEQLGMRLSPQEKLDDNYMTLILAMHNSLENFVYEDQPDPARPELGIFAVMDKDTGVGMRIVSKRGSQLTPGPGLQQEYLIFGLEPIGATWSSNILGRAEAFAKAAYDVGVRIQESGGEYMPIVVDASNLPDAVRGRLEEHGLQMVQLPQPLVKSAGTAPSAAVGQQPLRFQILPPVDPDNADIKKNALKRSEALRKQYEVNIPQIWDADFMPKGGTSEFDTGLFLASYDKWHGDTMWEQFLAMRQHRINRERLEDFVDSEGLKGFAVKRRLRDLGEALLVRRDLDYWVHDDAGYSRGSEKVSYEKGSDESLWAAVTSAEGAKKMSSRHRMLFELAKDIRTEAKYAPLRQLLKDMNDAQVRITKMGQQAKLFKGGIYSYASLGWKDRKGDRVFEMGPGSAVGLLEVGQAGGPFREDVGYRRYEKQLVSVLSGWANGLELVLPNALDAAARTHRVVAEARYNKAWASGLEAAGLIKVISENKAKPGYVRLKADTLSQYQAIPWIAQYINNATTQFGLRDIKNPLLRWYMKATFAAKHLMLAFGFFHHQAFMRSYLFTVTNKEFGDRMKDVKGLGSIASASAGSYAKAVGRMRGEDLRTMEERFRPMQEGREAWMRLTPELEMLVRAGLTVQLSNELTQNLGGAYYTPEDTSETDSWFDKAKAKIDSWGIGAVATPMLDMVDNMRTAQRETAEWLFNTMGANMKIAAALIKFQELRAKHQDKLKTDDGSHLAELARIAAEQVNADFGGLDLRGRSGKMSDYFGQPGPRNPVTQMVLRGLFLAPDWTESNLTAFLGMLKRGKRYATPQEIQDIQMAAYRTMWSRVAARALSMTFFMNLLMAGLDDEKELMDLYAEAGLPGMGDEEAPKATKLRWLDVNMSRISPNESRKFLSVWGHFLDPFKMSVDGLTNGFLTPVTRKGAVFAKGLVEFVTGTQSHSGRRYNSLEAFMGWDEESGVYSRDMTLPDGTRVKKGDRRPGRYEGQLTRNSVYNGSVRMEEVPFWAWDQATKFVPLQLRAAVDYATGSHDGLDTLTQMFGIKASRTYPDPKPQ